MDQMKIDEEEVGLALGAPDDVVVPDLLRECPTHRFPSGRRHTPAQLETWMPSSARTGVLPPRERVGHRRCTGAHTGTGTRTGVLQSRKFLAKLNLRFTE
ncbi:hypothetical protein Sm713_18610 [Streptomyces sp. TS71-3]|nr:hypothetical protein Sm713_18610 [Streptomyces sp. TS71-3]